MLRDWLRAEITKFFDSPQLHINRFGLWWDYADVRSLPVGPGETGAQWYANNRLGYNTLVAFIVGPGLHHAGEIFVYLTRVMEKPALLSCAILLDIVKQLPIKPMEHSLDVWQDAGRHFRAYDVLSCLANNVISQAGCHTGWYAGHEHHMKGRPDGIISALNRIRDTAKNGQTISELEHLADLYRRDGDIKGLHEGYTFRCPLHVKVFWPPNKTALRRQIRVVVPASLPCVLSHTHCYTFSKNDRRRQRLTGNGDERDVLTAVDVRTRLLPGFTRAVESEKTRMRFCPVGEALPEDIADPDVEEGDRAVILHETKVHDDWRISYRKGDVENDTKRPQKFRARLQRKLMCFKPLLPQDGTRHAPLSTHSKGKSVKALRAVASSSFFRAKRPAKK